MKNKILFIFISFLVLSGTQFKCSEEGDASINAILEANKKFAFDIYHNLKVDEGNIFYSPYGLSTALAMTYAGAKGETKSQMAKVLHLNEKDKDLHKSFGIIQEKFNKLSSEVIKLELANGLWADRNWKFLDSYFDLINNDYKAVARNIDMQNKVKTAEIINKWTSDKTHGKIDEIVSPDDFDLARLVLTNAIYFKGTWKYKFDKENTKKNNFFLHDKSKVKVDFMQLSDTLNYFENERAQVLEIPYSGEDISMILILPDKRSGIRNFEKDFSLEEYERWNSLLKPVDINIFIPKFKLEYEKEFKQVLSDLGMPIAFSQAADFSGMTGKLDLQIDEVKHKSFIEINEEGSEAAAVTVVIMREKSAVIKKAFNANRPFIIIIKENSTNSILFMGRIENPNS